MLPPKPQQLSPPSNQAGFTIIESLMAIIVVSILMIAIAPVIVLSVATRVQARRVELAADAARGYVDGVRSGAIPAPLITNGDIKSILAPSNSATLTCTANSYCTAPTDTTYQIYCVDGNNDGLCTKDNFKDMLVQAFGRNTDTSTDNKEKAKKGYQLGIRIYRGDAFNSSGNLKRNSNTGERVTSSTATGGLGDTTAPLFELTTEIVTDQTRYSDICNRLSSNGCQ